MMKLALCLSSMQIAMFAPEETIAASAFVPVKMYFMLEHYLPGIEMIEVKSSEKLTIKKQMEN